MSHLEKTDIEKDSFLATFNESQFRFQRLHEYDFDMQLTLPNSVKVSIVHLQPDHQPESHPALEESFLLRVNYTAAYQVIVNLVGAEERGSGRGL